MGTAIVGTVMAAGAILSAREQERQGDVAAAVGHRRAENERRLAVMAELRGQEEERRLRSIGARRQGEMVTQVAASGLALEGSPLDVLVDQAVQDDLEARTARFNADEEARQRRLEAEFLDIEAESADRAGEVNALTTLLGAGLGIGKLAL